ncbi:hypothetical protein ACH5RR_040262 [Cinchona calisaya]|uniref:Uncharacterized protein n=1 Tax=Cinchona calisaya TaxID=153742 RepID=A0ABD2XVH4_9GENT
MYLKQSAAYLLAHGGGFMLLSAVLLLAGVLLVTIDALMESMLKKFFNILGSDYGGWLLVLQLLLALGCIMSTMYSKYGRYSF